ncbi:MAG TPA: hypothetical protein VGB36_07260 [Gammaproteobacteria bacterium]
MRKRRPSCGPPAFSGNPLALLNPIMGISFAKDVSPDSVKHTPFAPRRDPQTCPISREIRIFGITAP